MTIQSPRGTAVVTGASSGIGEVYADRLARRGYDLILVARSKGKLGDLAKRLLAQTGRSVEVLAADLATAEGTAAVERRISKDASITLLVNNAGTAASGPTPEGDIDAVEQMININVTALTRLSDAAGRAFVARKSGAIINIASVMAYIVTPVSSAYAATKAYVLHFTRGLEQHLSPRGVRVQAVLPGYTRTPLISGIEAGIPADRIMSVDDLVDAALAGFDQGETVTIPSLEDPEKWAAFDAARAGLYGDLSRDKPAARYGLKPAVAA